MISYLQGGCTCYRGFIAFKTIIGTHESSANDEDCVQEHPSLQYLCKKTGHYLHDFRPNWFSSFRLPPSNGKHTQLIISDIRRLTRMRRGQHRRGHQGGGRGKDKAKIQVFSRFDLGHTDFFGDQFDFFIPPPPFYEGTRLSSK